jgi:hypothetical protein
MTNHPPQRHRGENVAVLCKTRKDAIPKTLTPAWNGDFMHPNLTGCGSMMPAYRFKNAPLDEALLALESSMQAVLGRMFGDVLMVLEWMVEMADDVFYQARESHLPNIESFVVITNTCHVVDVLCSSEM